MPEISQFIEQTLREAGKIVLDQFGKDGVLRTKSDKADYLTRSDLLSHTFVTERIKKAFPSHGIISEEDEDSHAPADDGVLDEKEEFWILDPIDGTSNFATKIPLFGVMLAYMKNQVITATGIYLPVFDEYYSAELGKGAKLNGSPISCTKKNDWPETFGCTNASLSPEKKRLHEAIGKARQKSKFWLSALGSAAVSGSYVAAGRRDWYMTQGSMLWDYAPVSLLLKEAGCTVTNFDGEPWKINHHEMVAASPNLHKTLLELLRE